MFFAIFRTIPNQLPDHMQLDERLVADAAEHFPENIYFIAELTTE